MAIWKSSAPATCSTMRSPSSVHRSMRNAKSFCVIDAPSRASALARLSRPASARPAKPNCLLRHLLLAALHPDRFPETSSACSATPIVGAAAGEKTRLRHETTWRRNLSDEEQHDDDGQGSDHSGEGFDGHCARSHCWNDGSRPRTLVAVLMSPPFIDRQ